MSRNASKSSKPDKGKTVSKSTPATKKVVTMALKEGMKRYKNTLKDLAKK